MEIIHALVSLQNSRLGKMDPYSFTMTNIKQVDISIVQLPSMFSRCSLALWQCNDLLSSHKQGTVCQCGYLGYESACAQVSLALGLIKMMSNKADALGVGLHVQMIRRPQLSQHVASIAALFRARFDPAAPLQVRLANRQRA